MGAEATLEKLGIILPEGAAPAALYVPYTATDSTLYISGQLPLKEGKPLVTGKLGDTVTIEQGQAAARQCAINILAQARAGAGGNLDRIKRLLKLEILVSCVPDFSEPHVVANGASQVMLDVFGPEIGSHARVAYGVCTLPLNVAVEVAATFDLAA
ncbi:MAG: RidA family protein [Hyphomicrobiales bacterium]|nr:RidA family protein [Rickettsiales bacterium]MCP5361176.1 RidA family protein [Hyphomicrobiales bacterium]